MALLDQLHQSHLGSQNRAHQHLHYQEPVFLDLTHCHSSQTRSRSHLEKKLRSRMLLLHTKLPLLLRLPPDGKVEEEPDREPPMFPNPLGLHLS